MPVSEQPAIFSTSPIDKKAWVCLKMLPKSKEPILIHAELSPMPFAYDNGEGVIPVMWMAVGLQSRYVYGLDLIPVAKWKQEALPTMLNTFQKSRTVPGAICVADERLLQTGLQMAQALDVQILVDEHAFDILDDVIGSLMDSMNF